MYTNPEHEKEYQRKHYLANKALYKERAAVSRKRLRIRNRAFINRIKLWKGCSVCGYKKYHGALHFHHTRDKQHSLGFLRNQTVSLETLKQEIRKCIILCANCHAEEHQIEAA